MFTDFLAVINIDFTEIFFIKFTFQPKVQVPIRSLLLQPCVNM